MYLTRAAVKATLDAVHELSGDGSQIAHDMWHLVDDPGPLGTARRSGAGALSLIGEPVTFGVHPEDYDALPRSPRLRASSTWRWRRSSRPATPRQPRRARRLDVRPRRRTCWVASAPDTTSEPDDRGSCHGYRSGCRRQAGSSGRGARSTTACSRRARSRSPTRASWSRSRRSATRHRRHPLRGLLRHEGVRRRRDVGADRRRPASTSPPRSSTYIPEFGTNGKDVVTVEQVMLHTSGFPHAPLAPLDGATSDGPARVRRVAAQLGARAPRTSTTRRRRTGCSPRSSSASPAATSATSSSERVTDRRPGSPSACSATSSRPTSPTRPRRRAGARPTSSKPRSASAS